MTENTEITVSRNEDKERYEIHVDGIVAGYTEFVADRHGRVVFPHTEIDHAFAGRGLGTILVGRAMADMAERGETVVPVCPFVVKYLRKHEVPGLDVYWRPTAVETGSDTIEQE